MLCKKECIEVKTRYLDCINVDKYTTLEDEKRLKILQTMWLSVNTITLGYSIWVKAGQTFLNLFIGSNRVIACSESSIVRSDVYFFVEASTTFFRWSIAALFQYTFDEIFTAKFKFFRGNVIATVCLTTHTKHLRTSEFFFEDASSLLSCCFCFIQHVRGRSLIQHQ